MAKNASAATSRRPLLWALGGVAALGVLGYVLSGYLLPARDDSSPAAAQDTQANVQDAAQAEEERAAGQAFLRANSGRDGVVTLASGLQYEVLSEGAADGATPTADDIVEVHYRGTLRDGTAFDSSYDRGAPSQFGVDGVITGWTQALQMMRAGDKWRLFIPPHLAYGPTGTGPIPPHAVLIFDVELIRVMPPLPDNSEIAALIAEPVAAHQCGDAPALDGAALDDAAKQARRQAGFAWQDCMGLYLRDMIMAFEEKARALRQIDPNTVPRSQQRAVNAYFQSAIAAVTDAETALNAFEGIPAP